ncbi:MAG: exosortase E/protease, VPEID-CTERM system [Planctomycetaceae bacterium]
MTAAAMVRLGLLSLLLVGEVLCLTLAFDANVISRSDLGNYLLSYSRLAPQWAAVLVGAVLIQRQIRVHPAWTAWQSAVSHHERWPTALLAHGLAFAALWALSRQIFVERAEVSTWAMGAWWTFVAITGLTWLAAISPLSAWSQAVREQRWILIAAAAAGITAITLGWAAQLLWQPLSFLTFQSTGWLLAPWFNDIEMDAGARLIRSPRFEVTIAPVCSGYEGMGLAFVFLALFIWSFRDQLRFPQALAIIPCGVAIIWLLNSVRIATLFVIGDRISPALAEGGFHSQAGWLAFLLVTLGSAGLALKMPWLARSAADSSATATAHEVSNNRSPSVAYLLPFFALMLSSMVLAVVTVDVERAYAVKVVVVAAALWGCRSAYAVPKQIPVWPAAICGVIVFLLWFIMEQPDAEAGHRLAQFVQGLSPGERRLWLLTRVIGTVVTVPIAEELAFRGYLMRRIIDRDFERVPWADCGWLSLGVSSLLFGLMHDRFLPGVLAGFAYGWLARRTAGVTAPILAHGLTNGLIAGAVLAGDAWWLWT